MKMIKKYWWVILAVIVYWKWDLISTMLANKKDEYKKGVKPQYRNHNGLFGVLDHPLMPNESGRVKISGYAIAWVNVLKEMQVSGFGSFQFYNLRPAEKEGQMTIKGGGHVLPFVIGADDVSPLIGVTQKISGSAHIITPSDQRWTVAENKGDPIYRLLPQGFQLMRIWLGSSNPDFWAELYGGTLEQ